LVKFNQPLAEELGLDIDAIRVRSDMTYFTAPNNGAVFSVGSMAFAQALPVKNFDNSASRVLNNVVNAFIEDGPLPGRYWISDEKQWR
jgi:N,N-dimethylformamidase